MSIPMNSHCVDCLLKKHNTTARSLGDDDQAYRLSKGVMQMILDAAPEDSSAVIASRINPLYVEIFGQPEDRYREEKETSNRFVLIPLIDSSFSGSLSRISKVWSPKAS